MCCCCFQTLRTGRTCRGMGLHTSSPSTTTLSQCWRLVPGLGASGGSPRGRRSWEGASGTHYFLLVWGREGRSNAEFARICTHSHQFAPICTTQYVICTQRGSALDLWRGDWGVFGGHGHPKRWCSGEVVSPRGWRGREPAGWPVLRRGEPREGGGDPRMGTPGPRPPRLGAGGTVGPRATPHPQDRAPGPPWLRLPGSPHLVVPGALRNPRAVSRGN